VKEKTAAAALVVVAYLVWAAVILAPAVAAVRARAVLIGAV